ncbi:hypothetical protein EXIGLDRAFT_719453 [Exidia glandulosa HHB12029]|uniref:F-box domain-containing protein n=1 Tax=Exidia glandulosa HHB12029 TaxID=1314781 RepID=A0A165NPW4_EXIGL|nr:hypothetical protein EXIGLDRAFT_719453 [Exidia glandulosa HHB12029]
MAARAFVLPEGVKSFLEQQIDQAIFISKSDHGVHDRLEEQRLLAAIQQCATNRVAFHKRRLNAAQPYNRLPREIWCMIWAQLPPKRMLKIARVCSDWRTYAIAERRLWTSHTILIDFPTAHCDCGNDWGCKDDGDHYERATEKYMERNLFQMALFLERSGDLSFHLDVTVGHASPDPRVAQRLADELVDYTERLTTLRYCFASVESMTRVFSELGSLPALQTLEFDCCDGDFDELHLSELYLPDMPSLHTLRFCFKWVMWDVDIEQFCDLRTLATPVSSLDQFQRVLHSCQKLHTLETTFIYGPDNNLPMTQFEDIASRLAAIRTVTLKYDSAWDKEARRLAVLAKDGRHMTFDYHGKLNLERATAPLSFLEHLGRSISHFKLAVEGVRFTLEVHDDDDRSRRVVLNDAAKYITNIASVAWNVLDARAVTHATVDWSLLRAFLAAIPQHGAESITTLSIHLPSSLSMNALIMDALPSSAHFPRLTCLSLEAAQDAVVTASGVSRVVRAIVPSGRRLQTLRLVRTQVLVDNDSALLDVVEAVVSTRDIGN